ncbi:D-alanyl-D-alanine carboxypeptidase/D-alanyl-D-alanine endopeptidase [Massilia sp. DWR3-1-1]|uniref:D-alanyl-D-alanine carboxypeptidase/D-alanyl-D-alanine endopeptidase n=1 Tax=Massilia sp. DWR3-1-1 TaxID=2804559 RepID=UPI003CF32E21
MVRCLATAVLLACLPLAQAQLPEPVASKMAANNIAPEAISVLVLRGEAPLLAHLAERPMQPASTMKLLTTLVALETLGPVFRGRTELRSSAPVVGGTLRGDLVLRGGADADFSGEVLLTMLQALRNQGIETIAGNLVLDRSLFSPARTDRGLPPFDEAPDAYYNVIPDALLINKNMVQLDMRSRGGKLRLTMQPALAKVVVDADMRLVDVPCARWEDGWQTPDVRSAADGTIKLMLHGTFPNECAKTYSVNVLDRQDYLDRLFRASWRQVGGRFKGAVVDGVMAPEAMLLAEHAARALPEIVRDINKPSDNALARTIFLSLGALEADALLGSRPLAASTDSTYTRADAAVRRWMRERGIDDTGMVLENGSGLSRLERISPVQLGRLLQAGLRSDWAPEFLASMPIVGVDGTMRRRLKDSAAAGHARMKTGTLSNVAAIAGYVRDASGQQCVVVAMINSDQVKDGKGRAVLDALVDWVARQGLPVSGDSAAYNTRQ